MRKRTLKLVLTAMMASLAFVLNTFVYFPAMAPFQHFVNVIAAAFLGPWYGCLSAFICGILRMMSGRTIQAVVGAIFGPILGGLLYKKTKSFFLLALGEVIGTGILGALAVYPLMTWFYGLKGVDWYYYVPFYIPSAVVGALMGIASLMILKKSGAFQRFMSQLEDKRDKNEDRK